MDNKKKIEIPFGAFDSELVHQEINIPKGFKAVINGNKIILTRVESENEKIRKAIHIYLDWLDGHKDYQPKGDYTIKDMIAWLEKQGEQIDIANKEYWRGYREGKQEIIDKYSNLEKQGDQTPSDKVEPKFKVGDWVVVDDGRTGRIIECTKDFADVDLEFSCLSTRVNNIRSWTIQDAKVGDVLAINWHEGDDSWEKIIIFKKYHNKGVEGLYSTPCVEGYGNTFKNGKLAFLEEVPYYSKTWTVNLHLATKEQRDALIKAMADAGYEWDVEKKELKKIENKNHLLSDFFKAEYERGKADVLKSIAWSEEDEEMLRSIIATCELAEQDRDSSPARHLLEMQLNWLKSLKQRYTWKPSDEQMKVCKEVYADILSAKGFDLGTVNSELNRLEEQLKKLSE